MGNSLYHLDAKDRYLQQAYQRRGLYLKGTGGTRSGVSPKGHGWELHVTYLGRYLLKVLRKKRPIHRQTFIKPGANDPIDRALTEMC